MEKILFAANGHLLNTHSVDFACYLAKLTSADLTGIFVEEDILELVPPPDKAPSLFKGVKESQATNHVITDVDQSMRYFTRACHDRNIRSDAFHKTGAPVENILRESRFSDLLVIGSETVFNPIYNEVPTPLTKQVLAKSECPVVVTPTLFKDIDTIVFCYDESNAAMFAMKQFTYLFQQYRDKKCIVLEVGREKADVVEKEKIRSWVGCYYPQVDFEMLEGRAPEELFKYLLMKEGFFVVMGAYGRNFFSTLFRHSTADSLLKRIDLPLFLTHH